MKKLHVNALRPASLLAAAILLAAMPGAWATSQYFQWDASRTAWDTSTTDWATLSGGSYNVAWTSGNDAVFETTAGTVTIGASGPTAHNLTFNVTGYTISGGTLTLNGTTPTLSLGSSIAATISSQVSGSAGLELSGTGTLTLSGANNYTGATTITGGGTLVANNGTALGASTSTLTFGTTANQGVEGTLQINAALSNPYPVSFGAYYVNSGTIQLNYASPSVTLGALTLNQQNTLNITAGGSASGTPTLTFAATGNTFGANNASKSSTNAPVGVAVSLGAITTTAYSSGTAPLTQTLALDGTSTGNQITGVISDSGSGSTLSKAAITKQNSSTWTLSGDNTYTGGTAVNGGTLVLSGNNNNGASATMTLASLGSPVLQLVANTHNTSGGVSSAMGTASGKLTFNTGATIQLRSDSDVTFSGGDSMGGLGNAWSGTIDVNQINSGNNNHTISFMTVGSQFGGSTANAVATWNVTGGNGYRLSLGGLTGTGGGTGQTLKLNPTSANLTLASVTAGGASRTLQLDGTSSANIISGIIADASSTITNIITKQNTSTWALNGANTTIGTTTVGNGELDINNWGATTAGAIKVGDAVNAVTATLGIGTSLSPFTLNLGGNSFIVGNGSSSSYVGIVNHTAGTVQFTSGNALLVGTGSGGANGTYNLSGGTLTIPSGLSSSLGVVLGVNTGCSGTFNLSGTGTLTDPSTLQIARQSTPSAVNTSGTFNQTGGTATIGTLSMGNNSTQASGTGSATLSLSGGMFSATTFSHLAEGLGDTCSITIGGSAQVTLGAFPTTRGTSTTTTLTLDSTTGYLSPTAASSTYMSGFSHAYLTANGANFNVPNSKDITVAQKLEDKTTAGTLTKSGVGAFTLTGANSYSGATTVSAGTLNTTTASTGAGSYSVSDNATLGVSIATAGQTLNMSSLTLGSSVGPSTLNITLGASDPTVTVITDAGALTLNGNVTVNVSGGASLSGATVVLMSYASGGSGTITPGTLPTLTGYTTSLVNDTSAKQLKLVFTPNLRWNTGNGDWDLITANWQLTTGGGNLSYSENSPVTFDDNASGTSPISVNLTANRTPSSVTANNSTKDYSLTGSAINGSTSLTKSGSGTLTVGTANGYTGGTTVSAGTLAISGSGTLGATTGALTMSGGTVDLGGTSQTVGALTHTSGTVQNGTLNLPSGNFTAQAGTLSANLQGTGAVLQKTTTGTLTMSGNNTFSGGVTLTGVSGSQLNINSANALGTGTFTIQSGNSGVIDNTSLSPVINANNNQQTWNNHFTFTGSADLDLGTGTVTLGGNRIVTVTANTLSVGGGIGGGAFSLTKLGAGTLALSGANTYSGGTTISAGALLLKSSSAAPSSGTYTIGNTTGGTLEFDGTGGAISFGNAISVTWGQSYGGSDLTPVIRNIAGNNTVTSSGLAPNAAGGNVWAVQSDAGTLNINSTFSPTSGTGGRYLQLQGAGTGVFGGTIQNGTATINLAKLDGGTWTLSGPNTYSGGTTISGGTLIAGSASALGTTAGTVSLANGTTLTLGTTSSMNQYNIANNLSSGGNSSTITLDPGSSTAGFTHTLGTLTIGGGGSQTLNFTANNFSSVPTLSFSSMGGGAVNNTCVPTIKPVGVNLTIGSYQPLAQTSISTLAEQTGQLLFSTLPGGSALIDNSQFSSTPFPNRARSACSSWAARWSHGVV
jgi:autotransporter-associated beta strand protein